MFVRNMTWLLIIIMVSGTFFSCSSSIFGKWKQDKNEESGQIGEEKKSVAMTFLDTLNENKELSLLNHSSFREENDTEKSATKVTATGYRIQLLASSSIESVREKKKGIEAQLQLSAYIIFDNPYYKILVGNFAQRTEAERALMKIRTSYPGAWIVNSEIVVDQ